MNQNLNNMILNTKEQYEEWLLELDDVHAVSIGYKVTDGMITNNLAIVIHTENKKEIGEIPQGQFIPSFLNGIPTDVIEMPPFETLPIIIEKSNVDSVEYDDRKYRPVPGGVEIYMPRSSTRGGLCTLGMYAISVKPGESIRDLYLLTNAHCLSEPNQEVRQPESPSPEDTIAFAARTVNSEVIDGGIAKITNIGLADPFYIEDIGVPVGTYDITIDDIGKGVIKRGRTTFVTTGYIAYIDVTLTDKKHQIVINSETPFAAPGDSGSVVLMLEGELKDNVIGLLWGGALTYAILSPVQAVMDELQIELLTKEFQIYNN